MNNKTTTTSSRSGSFRSIFALGALAVGTLVVTPAPAQAAKITVSGYGHSVTVDCDCLSFPSGTSCESFCDDLDSGWNGISCSYNPMNGTVTITHGALAWIPEREFVTSSGDINFGASGGASLHVEPEKGFMTIQSAPGELELAALTGDGVLYEADNSGTLTFPLDAGAMVSMIRTGAPPIAGPAAEKNDKFGASVHFSTSNGTCSANPGDLKPKQESTPVEKETTLKSSI